ncbi:hypothetical protein K435DRAFT_389572 [Dendrothele bispora CBS 962.96]|uniref:Uncharacterized protein n=1 Tax=Dendrothele bispora (strain CBS 962.96) TaxID=1314807 RepID=A0A4S8L9I4_DENBC|nr:hypothetical protein K435DRAFT_389572 [Dendrothele bispora CBS 962.96]
MTPLDQVRQQQAQAQLAQQTLVETQQAAMEQRQTRLDPQSNNQWHARDTPSPAFSTISVPSLPSTSPQGRGLPSSYPHGPQPHRPALYSRQHSGGNLYAEDYSSAMGGATIHQSNSAPSHQVAFDRSTMYPQGMLLEPSSAAPPTSVSSASPATLGLGFESTGGGPVRRHRSMTPSLYRGGENGVVRRPGSSHAHTQPHSHSFHGLPHHSHTTDGVYHPHPYATSSRASSRTRGPSGGSSSVQSSPATGSMSLGLPGMGMSMNLPRSESRASNLSVSGTSPNNALGLNMRPGSSAGSMYGGDIYRSDSPAPFNSMAGGSSGAENGNQSQRQVTDSPAPFAMELPNITVGMGGYPTETAHAATMPVQGVYGMNHSQGQGHSMQNGAGMGYNTYSHPHHVSTM